MQHLFIHDLIVFFLISYLVSKNIEIIKIIIFPNKVSKDLLNN